MAARLTALFQRLIYQMLYYILYGFLYVLSLLPWRVLYLLSDGLYLVVYYGTGYRRKVVMQNLAIAFPEKTEAQRLAIAKAFYQNFIDSFLEIIKLLRISEAAFRKRVTSNVQVMNELKAQGVPNIAMVSAHFFNWEFANLATSLLSHYPMLTVYMPVKNKAFDKLMVNLRSKFGSRLIPATTFRTEFHKYANDPYALGLVSDQNPGDPASAFWIPFFGKPLPFVKGAEKSARVNKSAVVFVHFYKTKRGHYHLDYQLVTTDAKSYPSGQLTKTLVQLTEAAIRKTPANYLWSHRRWKWEFKEQYRGLLVE